MRTFDEFWNDRTPEDAAMITAALDEVARAQGEDFTTWREFCAWDLGPHGAHMSRSIFEIVQFAMRGMHPHVEALRVQRPVYRADGRIISGYSPGIRAHVGVAFDATNAMAIVKEMNQQRPDLFPWAEGGLFDKVTAERRKQIGQGHDAEHDDWHQHDELARAAACYAAPEYSRESILDHQAMDWPFDQASWRPTPDDRKRELIKAMALLVAEYERLERMTP